jgi:GT2 family glycosyltransferase
MRDIHLSIVSHGQALYAETLLRDLAALASASRFQVTLTNNLAGVAAPSVSACPFPVRVIDNSEPLGFGANHNRAFAAPHAASERVYFVVLNPDLRIAADVFGPLAEVVRADRRIGLAGPVVSSTGGEREDSARELPTPFRLVRKLAGRSGAWPVGEDGGLFRPDWIAGMFMLFRAETFAQIGGFDERFFLYYEDVDICSRLWLHGYEVVVDPSLSIVHDAQRTSRRNWRYARWHLASMLRFLSSDVCWRARRLHRHRLA